MQNCAPPIIITKLLLLLFPQRIYTMSRKNNGLIINHQCTQLKTEKLVTAQVTAQVYLI